MYNTSRRLTLRVVSERELKKVFGDLNVVYLGEKKLERVLDEVRMRLRDDVIYTYTKMKPVMRVYRVTFEGKDYRIGKHNRFWLLYHEDKDHWTVGPIEAIEEVVKGIVEE